MDLVTALTLRLVFLPLRKAALARWRDDPARGAAPCSMFEGLGEAARDFDLVALTGRAERHARATARAGLQVVWLGHPGYPPLLDAIPDPPPVCWVEGALDVLRAPAVAIVGSRAVAPDTAEAVTAMASDLAAAGLVVVSGLARGVDAAAHRGALATGRTIAVLGSSHDRLYPAEHDALAARIVGGGGALVSEWPPATPALPGHFPARNRIVSGLSRGVVVAEASGQSGALITAAHALSQGREVMAMPGTPWGGRNRGAHGLVKDGAPLVEDAADVVAVLQAAHALDGWEPEGSREALAAVGLVAPPGMGPPPGTRWCAEPGAPSGGPSDGLPDEQVLAEMSRLGRATADELGRALGWPADRLLAVLSGLELDGRAVRTAGGWILARGS